MVIPTTRSQPELELLLGAAIDGGAGVKPVATPEVTELDGTGLPMKAWSLIGDVSWLRSRWRVVGVGLEALPEDSVGLAWGLTRAVLRSAQTGRTESGREDVDCQMRSTSTSNSAATLRCWWVSVPSS